MAEALAEEPALLQAVLCPPALPAAIPSVAEVPGDAGQQWQNWLTHGLAWASMGWGLPQEPVPLAEDVQLPSRVSRAWSGLNEEQATRVVRHSRCFFVSVIAWAVAVTVGAIGEKMGVLQCQ